MIVSSLHQDDFLNFSITRAFEQCHIFVTPSLKDKIKQFLKSGSGEESNLDEIRLRVRNQTPADLSVLEDIAKKECPSEGELRFVSEIFETAVVLQNVQVLQKVIEKAEKLLNFRRKFFYTFLLVKDKKFIEIVQEKFRHLIRRDWKNLLREASDRTAADDQNNADPREQISKLKSHCILVP